MLLVQAFSTAVILVDFKDVKERERKRTAVDFSKSIQNSYSKMHP